MQIKNTAKFSLNQWKNKRKNKHKGQQCKKTSCYLKYIQTYTYKYVHIYYGGKESLCFYLNIVVV